MVEALTIAGFADLFKLSFAECFKNVFNDVLRTLYKLMVDSAVHQENQSAVLNNLRKKFKEICCDL